MNYLKKLKNAEDNDLEDMVNRMELTCDEIVDLLDIKYIATSSTGYTVPPGNHEIGEINLMLKSLLLEKVKIFITIDDVRLKSNLATEKKQLGLVKKNFSIQKRVYSMTLRSFERSTRRLISNDSRNFQK